MVVGSVPEEVIATSPIAHWGGPEVMRKGKILPLNPTPRSLSARARMKDHSTGLHFPSGAAGYARESRSSAPQRPASYWWLVSSQARCTEEAWCRRQGVIYFQSHPRVHHNRAGQEIACLLPRQRTDSLRSTSLLAKAWTGDARYKRLYHHRCIAAGDSGSSAARKVLDCMPTCKPLPS